MIIVSPSQPSTRPPIGSGPALEVGDIWQVTVSGARSRYDGTAWVAFEPRVIFSLVAPATRPAPNAGPLQPGDIWLHTNSPAGPQAVWDGTQWVVPQLPAGVVPPGGAATAHLAKASGRSFEMEWVDPAAGIVWLHEQRAPSDIWTVTHQLRSRWVTVTCVDNTRDPPVTMLPDIEYLTNQCRLYFAEPVGGFAVVHASRLTPDQVIH